MSSGICTFGNETALANAAATLTGNELSFAAVQEASEILPLTLTTNVSLIRHFCRLGAES